MKKLIALILCISTLLCFFSIPAGATSYLTLNEKSVHTISRGGDKAELMFSSTVNDSIYRIVIKNLSIDDRLHVVISDEYDSELVKYDYWSGLSKGAEKSVDLRLERSEDFNISVWTDNGEQTGNFEVCVTEFIDDVADSKEGAEGILLNQDVVREITANNDIDFFSFSSTPNDSYYRVSLKNLSVDDRICMIVYDKYDAELVNYDYWAGIGKSNEKHIDIKFAPNEKYYAAIWADSKSKSGTYNLNITEIIDDVPNSKESSKPLNTDTKYVATIEAVGDCDFFSFTANSSTLPVTVANNSIDDRLYMVVYDKYEAEVIKHDYWAGISKGSEKTVDLEATPGDTYWIYIRPDNNSALGDYAITIGEPHSTVEIKPVDLTGGAQSQAEIKLTIGDSRILVGGVAKALDVPAQIINSRTMVPLRAIFEALGASVEWNDSIKTVTSVRGSAAISLTIGDSFMYVNGKPVLLDVPAQIVDSRTLVPARAIAEAFGCAVSWDDPTKTVTIK